MTRGTHASASADKPLSELVWLSREVGREERRLAILGEGNTSADRGDGTFWVKASGTELGVIRRSDFSHVRFAPLVAALRRRTLSDKDVACTLRASRVNARQPMPSVETFLHALCLTEGKAKFVAHVHAEALGGFLCSRAGAAPFLRPLFPDQIVVCGPAPAIVPYTDPGFPLALAVRRALRSFHAQYGHPPRLLLMINHGPVALGQSARDALAILLMAEKWARILHLTRAAGGPRHLPLRGARRIHLRPDEAVRRRCITGASP